MKHVVVLGVVAALSCAAMLLSSCFSSSGAGGGRDIPEEPGEPLSLVEFSYSCSGMSADSFLRFEAVSTGEGVRITAERIGYEVVEDLVDKSVMLRLGEIAGKYHFDLWDGFDRSDSRVSDGESFTLSAFLEGGASINAHGNNSFPSNYGDASDELMDYLRELTDPYFAVQEELFGGEE